MTHPFKRTFNNLHFRKFSSLKLVLYKIFNCYSSSSACVCVNEEHNEGPTVNVNGIPQTGSHYILWRDSPIDNFIHMTYGKVLYLSKGSFILRTLSSRNALCTLIYLGGHLSRLVLGIWVLHLLISSVHTSFKSDFIS